MGQEQFKREVLPLREQLLYYTQRLLGDMTNAEDIIQEVYLNPAIMPIAIFTPFAKMAEDSFIT